MLRIAEPKIRTRKGVTASEVTCVDSRGSTLLVRRVESGNPVLTANAPIILDDSDWERLSSTLANL